MRLSWDETKRQVTLEQRGLDFGRAAEVFSVFDVTAAVQERPDGERRFVTVEYRTGGLRSWFGRRAMAADALFL